MVGKYSIIWTIVFGSYFILVSYFLSERSLFSSRVTYAQKQNVIYQGETDQIRVCYIIPRVYLSSV